jgi:quercetin dioxygenase-like cupin family protein
MNTTDSQQRTSAHPLAGWAIARTAEVEWVPWGSGGDARAKVLAEADGFHVALVEADPGYHGDEHEHAHPEFLYVVAGELRNQGVTMVAGDAYAAAAGSRHTDFATDTGATYVSIFRL